MQYEDLMRIWSFHMSFDFHLLRYSTKGASHINKQGFGILLMLCCLDFVVRKKLQIDVGFGHKILAQIRPNL
jgi:hypothetical protein